MPVITENAFFKMKAGVNPEDSNSIAAQRLAGLLDLVQQQPGVARQYWGIEVEDETIFVWSVDWENLEAHHNFMKTKAFETFVTEATELFDIEATKPMEFHTHFTSDAAAAREAPVTELNYFNLPKDFSDEQKTAFENAVLGVVNVCTKAGTCSSYAVGWVAETMPNDTDSSGEALAFNVMLGWPSVEEHIKVTKTSDFANARAPLPTMVKPVKALKNQRHVRFHMHNKT